MDVYVCVSADHMSGTLADELAKLGLEQEPSPDAYTSIGHIRRVMKRKTITNWKAYWEDEEDRGEAAQGLGKQYTRNSPSKRTRPS